MSDLTLLEKLAVWALPVLFAITLHEVAHGWIAEKLGDPTARRLGRISLNPVRHIDPIGTLLVPGLLLAVSSSFGASFIFGWAKPVPVTWENLRRPKRDMALVAAAGPGANLVMALLWALALKLIVTFSALPEGTTQGLALMCLAGVQINVVLMVLNLLPLPPLDGSRIVTGVLPDKAGYAYNRIEPYGIVILVVLLVTGVLGQVLIGPVSSIIRHLLILLGL